MPQIEVSEMKANAILAASDFSGGNSGQAVTGGNTGIGGVGGGTVPSGTAAGAKHTGASFEF